MNLGRVLDWLMVLFIAAVVVGCPMWAAIHFWP